MISLVISSTFELYKKLQSTISSFAQIILRTAETEAILVSIYNIIEYLSITELQTV